MIRRPDPPNTGLITVIGDPIVTVPDPGIYGITINRFKKGIKVPKNNQLMTIY